MDKNIRKAKIAIDGPVGSGKSTVAKAVAERLGIVYIDTGAMYRAVALYTKEHGVEWNDEAGVVELLPEIEIELESPEGEKKDGRNVTVYLNDKDVSWDVRKADMGEGASVVSQYKKVREKLVDLQRKMASGKSVIMEGRDIGTKVLPDAEMKIYMYADPRERARRKKEQISAKGEKISFEEALKDVETRDNREMNREIDPLRPAKGAWKLDSSDLSVEEVADRIAQAFVRLGK